MEALPQQVEVKVEVPRGSFVKRRADGSVDFVSPLPCPFNYGSVPGSTAPDGDPLDAVVLGPRQPLDHISRWPVFGVVEFVDAGKPDPKLICGPSAPSRLQWWTILAFFKNYAVAKRVLNRLRGDTGTTVVAGWRRR